MQIGPWPREHDEENVVFEDFEPLASGKEKLRNRCGRLALPKILYHDIRVSSARCHTESFTRRPLLLGQMFLPNGDNGRSLLIRNRQEKGGGGGQRV